MKKLSKKFWVALVLLGLVGQVAWVVENMYLNVFIYKMFNASASDISLMVSASSVAATLTTIFIGALSDYIGKRKLFICSGYIVWGISILGFGFIRMDVLTPLCGSVVAAAALGVTLVIVLDCVMTFFGSAANDAAYNAWLTDVGDESNRGKIEGINAMMPLVSILVVFGGFMGFSLDKAESWSVIFTMIGGVVICLGIAGIFLVEETPKGVQAKEVSATYLRNVLYSFHPTTLKENRLLYVVIGAFAVFGISINTFMPYLIVYYEKSLGMSNYVLVLAPAIILAAVVTSLYGGLYDKLGFQKSVIPSIGMLMAGYAVLYFSVDMAPVFVGSFLMMSGYLTGMAVFGAMIRDYIPDGMAGKFQGIRIIGQVLIPGVIGPFIGAFVLRNAEMIENNDGTVSFLPNKNIWLAAFVVAGALVIVLYGIFRMVRLGHYNLKTDVSDRARWEVYPRPQMQREGYKLLNDNWTLNGREIKMPFPPQSMLSEYRRKVGHKLVYETSFMIPDCFQKERILLHFGAVDQVTEVYVNGHFVDTHEGGYLPFSMDITGQVKKESENLLIVKVTDALDKKYPYGKQCKKRGGMWYTPVSGIWQSVWLENVPDHYIESVKLTPDLEGIAIKIETVEHRAIGQAKKKNGFKAMITLENGDTLEEEFAENEGYITIPNPRLWTPEHPYLYDMTIMTDTDRIETYFALRTIAIEKAEGVNRVCLNGQPIFLHGVLDQGYYSDGIYLPAEPGEYERDVLRMKEMGFNMLRKHIKVEPEYFYYYCDKHGMLVVQDMVNNGSYSFLRDTALPTIGMKMKSDKKRMNETRQIFKEHSKEIVEHLYNHPSIVVYTIFNEGWGQFNSDEMYDCIKEVDDTRLYDATSGWFAQEKNDFQSEHIYFKTTSPKIGTRPVFVSECGGYARTIEGHCYSKYAMYGYGGAQDEDTLTGMIETMYEGMILAGIQKGICGAVYTQLSDVEDEVNGLYTYDRKVCKVNVARMKVIAEKIQREMNESNARRERQ